MLYIKHNYNQDNMRADHAMADILYRINIGNCFYGVVLLLPNAKHLISKKIIKSSCRIHNISYDNIDNMSNRDFNNLIYYDLDKWLYSQWEGMAKYNNFDLRYKYSKSGKIDYSRQYNKMRKTNLKEFYYIRYKNELILLGKTYDEVNRIKYAVINKLRRFEKIEIEDQSIIDMRVDKLYWYDFNFKLIKKRNKYACITHVNKDVVKNIYYRLKKQLVIVLKSKNNLDRRKNMIKYNKMVYDFHKKYAYAVCVNDDFSKIHWSLKKKAKHLFIRDNKFFNKKITKTGIYFIDNYLKQDNKYHMFYFNFVLIGVGAVKHRHPMFYCVNK